MKPKWHDNLILICEKCGSKLQNKSDENPSLVLKKWLKKKLVSESLWGKNRVVTTSCLDVCPEGKVTVSFVSDHSDLEAYAKTVDPVAGCEQILSIILERAKIGAEGSITSKTLIKIPEELMDIAPGYLKKRIRDLEVLKDALNRKDWETVANLSHKTKGTAAAYGFTRLGELAKSLENAAKSKVFTTTEQVLAEMKSHLESIKIAD